MQAFADYVAGHSHLHRVLAKEQRTFFDLGDNIGWLRRRAGMSSSEMER